MLLFSHSHTTAMEAITEGVNNINISDSYKKNRIQVSNTKKPLFFYVNLAKRYMQQHNEVELSALGMAIATVVTVAEILKNNELAIEKKITTSTVDIKDDSRGRPVQKAKVRINTQFLLTLKYVSINPSNPMALDSAL
uniref:DNA/RNA-binding protein Alba-like domain-containing protein n=1 Tax=Glycine max TaxID=3847 RepID=A0A0R0IVS3_SOYBN